MRNKLISIPYIVQDWWALIATIFGSYFIVFYANSTPLISTFAHTLEWSHCVGPPSFQYFMDVLSYESEILNLRNICFGPNDEIRSKHLGSYTSVSQGKGSLRPIATHCMTSHKKSILLVGLNTIPVPFPSPLSKIPTINPKFVQLGD